MDLTWPPADGGEQMPSFLAANNTKPFISSELMAAITEPELLGSECRSRDGNGIRAGSMLPEGTRQCGT